MKRSSVFLLFAVFMVLSVHNCTPVVEDENVMPVVIGTVSTPVFNVDGGTYISSVDVSLSNNTTGSDIYYTLNGTEPSLTNGTVYTGTFQLISTKSVKAIAIKSGWSNSAVIQKTYTIKVANPVILPAGGTFTGSTQVSITNATPGCTTRYTVNGTTPSPSNGFIYSGPFTISTSTTLRALAYKTGCSSSDVMTQIFTIN